MAKQPDYPTSALINKAKEERDQQRNRESRMPPLIGAAVLCGIGLMLALAVGGDTKEPPTCDGQTMTRGDKCVISSRGGRDYFSYEEMIDRRESSNTVWRWIGYGLVGLSSVIVVAAIASPDPSPAWGTPVTGPCPQCGKQNRREKSTTYITVSRSGRTSWPHTGIVTLCTCGFSAVKRP
ncbi:MAG: hypothetical protein HOZ81_42160 [Streptomyces sp.]|nr:hypothetical protein [Streptomyces sp.]